MVDCIGCMPLEAYAISIVYDRMLSTTCSASNRPCEYVVHSGVLIVYVRIGLELKNHHSCTLQAQEYRYMGLRTGTRVPEMQSTVSVCVSKHRFCNCSQSTGTLDIRTSTAVSLITGTPGIRTSAAGR
ncbi:hypothetical protein V6N12_050334 [Hibiscus sabdariffa]|uniref:Uncharacterized protein n=1 Tax=Hibiscus sabdariffa TaxID=183260 RepID=A0ABR2GCN8_9ROSI